jgi:hypothetical protein
VRFYNRAGVAYRSPSQLANRRRVERVIRLAAPALDLLLYAGDRVTRVVGRDALPPDPVRRAGLPPPKRD